MSKENKKKSLVYSIMRMSTIPIIILGVILTIFSQNSIQEGMSLEIKKSLSGTAHNLISIYNMLDAGEFSYRDGKFMKGETELTSDYRILDDVKNDTGADVTIFYGRERRLTTLVDESGARLVGTKVSSDVQETVLQEGEEFFSESADINGAAYFGYYVPIRNDAGNVIGISFAGKTVDSIHRSMRETTRENVVLCIFVILLAGIICNVSTRRMVVAIQHIKDFLGKLAHGDFSESMPEEVMERRDELADMGKYAVMVGHSLEDMISRDPLTGLLNRRACLIQAEKLKSRNHFVVAMGDIDFFKQVNDCYGHEKGDEVLCYVAEKLGETVPDEGFVSRWGGEEFLLGFCGEVQEMNGRLEAVLETISNTEFEYEGKPFHISMTFGITDYREGESLDEIVKRADGLMYFGKENGRNQIVLKKEKDSHMKKTEVSHERNTNTD